MKDGDVVFENFRYDYTNKYRFYLVGGYNGKTALLTPIRHTGGSRGSYGVGSDEVVPDVSRVDGPPLRKKISEDGTFSPIKYDKEWTDTGIWTGDVAGRGAYDGPEYELERVLEFVEWRKRGE